MRSSGTPPFVGSCSKFHTKSSFQHFSKTVFCFVISASGIEFPTLAAAIITMISVEVPILGVSRVSERLAIVD